ncbi:hypothetical protein A6769_22000 [Nostoc punctiforme NIES-2108]|uniref:Uncharacterized protein n=1 Tax=Nostoc punctiforme NIES-2108 TaxID=1356359 RepID=A0A367RGB7_NOSPU|nr:hypothetical protein A6769_22000 [Nostoc punctiforme NIES-2108]
MENPRQFSSLDASDAALHGSLTKRPASAVAAGDPIDFEAISARVRYERTLPTYQYKESPAEFALRLERQVAAEQRIRAETAATNEKNRLLLERAQVQRSGLQSRINGSEVIEAEFAQTRRKSPLAQIQRSTPERQPLPSTGSPPPTLKGTAARADSLVEPTATPRPAILREAIATGAGNAITALPKALPQAAGRLVIPGVGAALSIGTRLVVGQSVTQAVTSTVAGSIGYGAGLLIGTAIGGPIGGVVGAMVGSTAASLFSDWLFAQNLPKGTAHLETFIPNYPPFVGAQQVGGAYHLTLTYIIDYGGGVKRTFTDTGLVFSPIASPSAFYDPSTGTGYSVPVHDYAGNPITAYFARGGGGTASGIKDIQLTFVYGTPDNGQNIVQPVPPTDNSPYRYDSSPVGSDNVVPSGIPAAGKSKPQSRDIAPSMPSNNTPNGARGFVGHGGLAPSYLPNPEHQPSNLGGMLPAIKNAPQPLPFAEPEDIPVPRTPISEATATTTATNPSTFAYPAYTPQTAQPIPTSDALSPVPKSKSAPIAKTPTETALDQQKKDFEEQIGRITAIATAIAALTPAIQGLPDAIAKSPSVQAANKETTQGAVCEIAQPGGCLGAPIKQAEDAAKANGNKLNDILTGLNTAGSAAQLALLDTINGKLGDQLPGGIGGKLSRFADWMHLDRVLNILIFAATIHNALMLSNDIGQTLVGAINNVLQTIGLKKEDGSSFDIGSVISSSIENLIKGAIGADNYTNLREAWAKANRIYQATNNVINSFLNLSQTILQASELIASYTGKIGNALKKGGVILESAYGWMNPQPKFNRVTQTLESLQNGASTIQMVTQAPLDVVNAVAESTTAATEFVKAVKEDDKPVNKAVPIPEPDELKAKETQSKTDSQPLNFDFSDLFDGED